MTGFLAFQGYRYPRDGGSLMVVGRAVNGFEHDIDPVRFNDPAACGRWKREGRIEWSGKVFVLRPEY